MASVTIQEAQAHLTELVHLVLPEEALVISEDGRSVARLVKSAPEPPAKRRLGTMRGSVIYMASDFDATLDDSREYMA